MNYAGLGWWSLGMFTGMLCFVITLVIFDLKQKRWRASLPPPEAIRDLAADLARLSRRINDYAAGREEEREHAGAA